MPLSRRFSHSGRCDEDYSVEAVYDGLATLQKFRATGCDLMITDLMMPGMKGTELVKQVRSLDPDLPILLITAFGSIENAVEAMQAGAFYYVTKPFRSDEMILHVNGALEHRSLRSEFCSACAAR